MEFDQEMVRQWLVEIGLNPSSWSPMTCGIVTFIISFIISNLLLRLKSRWSKSRELTGITDCIVKCIRNPMVTRKVSVDGDTFCAGPVRVNLFKYTDITK